ncbi:glycoside hydrolase family 73 protein [Carnobacteriaceae bacterium zg-ZUI252]|nr:glycoside hydrolase family 73 protein [Carnobacteriaceae bacterium zg-ZUI252]
MKKKTKKKLVRTVQHSGLFFMIVLVGFVFALLMIVKSQQNTDDASNTSVAQIPESQRLAFFDKIRAASQQNQRDYGVFASITMAQAALESNFGTSGLASEYYNLFGVKGNAENGVLLPTLEFLNGQYVEIKDYFVVYPSWDASIVAHGQLLYNGTNWNNQLYRDVIIAKNYHDAAIGLVSGGYATDPNYASKIIQMIEQYKLYEYDK